MYTFDQRGGPLSIWKMPDPTHRYVIGADVAEGLEHGDYSVAAVLDAHTGELVAVWHGHIPPKEFGSALYKLGIFYHGALIGCESNNHGISTLDQLVSDRYPRLYRRRVKGEVADRYTLKWGWATNRQTKPLMIDALDQAMRDESIVVFDRHTLAEMRTYVRDDRGRLHGSPHDDRVIALAIAVQMLSYVHTADAEAFGVRDDYMTMDWWLRQATEAETPEVVPIGTYNRRSYGSGL